MAHTQQHGAETTTEKYSIIEWRLRILKIPSYGEAIYEPSGRLIPFLFHDNAHFIF